MSLRAPKDTVESLRLTLQRLEQFTDPAQDLEARTELKRILLLRIADLEALEALRGDAAKPSSGEIPKPTPTGSASELPQQVVSSSPDNPAVSSRERNGS